MIFLRSGTLGTLTNCTVIYLLWGRKYTSKLIACRVSITITSVQSVLSCFNTLLISNAVSTHIDIHQRQETVALTCQTHIIYKNNIICIMYGSLATLNEAISKEKIISQKFIQSICHFLLCLAFVLAF